MRSRPPCSVRLLPKPPTVYLTRYSNTHATINHIFCLHPFVWFHASSHASHHASNLYTCLSARCRDPNRPLQNRSIREGCNASRCDASAATRTSGNNPAGTYRPHPSLDVTRQATLPEPAANPCQHEHPCDHERLMITFPWPGSHRPSPTAHPCLTPFKRTTFLVHNKCRTSRWCLRNRPRRCIKPHQRQERVSRTQRLRHPYLD